MASNARIKHRRSMRRMCLRKTRYGTFNEAERAADLIVRAGQFDGKSELNAYHCRFCAGFHFGHSGVPIAMDTST